MVMGAGDSSRGGAGGLSREMDRRRVAELLGVVSKAMAELAEEFSSEPVADAAQGRLVARRRERSMAPPQPQGAATLEPHLEGSEARRASNASRQAPGALA